MEVRNKKRRVNLFMQIQKGLSKNYSSNNFTK
jgi:hypothetical protein